MTEPELIEPGKVYRYEIDLWVTSNLFKTGHRIRIEVSSSNFPRFDRNPNSGKPFGTDTKLLTATQTIYHNAAHSSHILLPVIPRQDAAQPHDRSNQSDQSDRSDPNKPSR
jgi:putative CocE/NonD family hydrolase